MLVARQMIPPLALRTRAGRLLRAWDYKQKKNRVIVFLHPSCAACHEHLERLAARASELKELEAVALVVFPEASPAAFAMTLPPEIVVGVDASGRSQRSYLGEEAFGPRGLERLGIFVADRYGELYAQWVVQNESELPGFDAVLSALRQIEIACEECFVSHWPIEQ